MGSYTTAESRLAALSLRPAPKYPWRTYSALRTHDFVDESDDDADATRRVFACRTCGRRFMYDAEMHETWAIAEDAQKTPLQEAVSSRWVAQRCAGKRLEADREDSRRVKTTAPRRTRATAKKAVE